MKFAGLLFLIIASLSSFAAVVNSQVINQQQNSNWPPGWTEKCLDCICQATSGCNETIGCIGDFCGAFLISRAYWMDADSPTLLWDNKNDPQAYVRCTIDLYCASRTVNQYIHKFIQDCNRDRSFSCDDYARLHFFGFAQCTRPITRTRYYNTFQRCFQRPDQTDEF